MTNQEAIDSLRQCADWLEAHPETSLMKIELVSDTDTLVVDTKIVIDGRKK